MPRYIDAEKFYEALSLCVTEIEIKLDAETDSSKVLKAVQNGLINFPTADVAPVVYAHWIFHKGVFANDGTKGCFECSACKAVIDTLTFDLMYECGQTKRCGVCGARMDEEVKENE